jgi:hypothetical protein
MINKAGLHAWPATRVDDGQGQAMARIYWYGLAVIYAACCVTGMILGYTWGIGGSILGMLMGAMVASVIALALNSPERMEAAIYTILSVVAVAALIYLIVTFWGVRF